jgi:geranylgeranyl diphosphate synthase, type II
MSNILKKYQVEFDNNLNKFFLEKLDKSKKELSGYALNGGKRLRPIICLEIFKLNNLELEDNIIKASIGIELLHNSSLIMDDLPCMDNDNYRRGRETVHFKYGVLKANILSKFFIFKALELFSNLDKILVDIVGSYIEKLCIGQQLDLSKNKIKENEDEIINRIALKTYPLFGISFLVGYVQSKNDKSNLKEVDNLAKYFSIIFQIWDDIDDYNIDINRGIGNEDNINYVIYFGMKRTIEIFEENMTKFKKGMEELSLFSDLFQKICDYLEIRIKNIKNI